MALTKVSDLNSLFSQIYEEAYFVARESNIMVQIVRNFTATGWMARNITKRPQITATEKAEGVDFTNPTTFGKSSAATLTPGMVMAQVILTDEDIETDPDSAREDSALEMGMAVATKIDTDLVGDFANFTSNNDKGPGAGNSATIADAAAAVSVLRNVPAPNPLYAVWHPFHWHDLWIELGQPASDKAFLGDVANEALRSFFVSNWMNLTHLTSANIAVDGGVDAVSGIFNPRALGFDQRKAPTMEPERDASLLAWELNYSAGYAHGVIRAEFGVKYTADATEPS